MRQQPWSNHAKSAWSWAVFIHPCYVYSIVTGICVWWAFAGKILAHLIELLIDNQFLISFLYTTDNFICMTSNFLLPVGMAEVLDWLSPERLRESSPWPSAKWRANTYRPASLPTQVIFVSTQNNWDSFNTAVGEMPINRNEDIISNIRNCWSANLGSPSTSRRWLCLSSPHADHSSSYIAHIVLDSAIAIVISMSLLRRLMHKWYLLNTCHSFPMLHFSSVLSYLATSNTKTSSWSDIFWGIFY